MTVSEYRAHPALNYSSLKHILSSPAHYVAALKAPREETAAMRLGTMLHKWWLEGAEDVLGDAVVKPEGLNFTTKEGKAWREENAGRFILTAEEWAQFLRRQASLTTSTIANLLRDSMPHRETPLFAEVEGVPLKALFDAHSNVAFLDLKTCQKNDPKSWGEAICAWHYDFQYAFYREVWRQNYEGEPAFDWVTVSDDEAPVVAVYQAENWLGYGIRKFNTALARYKEYASVGEQPLTAEVPYWLAAQERRAE